MLSVVLGIVILVLGIYIMKLKEAVEVGNEEINRLLQNDTKDEVKGFKTLSDRYMKLISDFSFSIEALYMEMKDVLCKIEGMSANAEQQSATVTSIEQFMDDVFARVQVFAEHAVDMAHMGDKAYETVHEKQTEITETVSAFKGLYEHLQQSAEKVTGLEEKTKVAESLIGSIDNLSSQTNLLALNASIEGQGQEMQEKDLQL